MLKNKVVLTEVLERSIGVPYSSFDTYFTKTTVFMLAAVGLKRSQLPSYFVNAFVRDAYRTHLYKYPIFLAFKLTAPEINSDYWRRFHASMKEHPNYLHYYTAGRTDGAKIIVYVLEVPELYHSDYEKFLAGKYSEFSDEYKSLFPPFITVKNEEVPYTMYQIIHKDPTLRDQLEELLQVEITEDMEFWSPPDVYTRETLQWPEANNSLLLDH